MALCSQAPGGQSGCRGTIETSDAKQRSGGRGTTVLNARVVVLLGGPAGARAAYWVEAPDRVLRMWSLLNAAVREELERSVSPALAKELHHLTGWPAGPRGRDELRVKWVSLLGWAGGLVLAMLGSA